MKTSFKPRVSRMGFGSFWISIVLYEILFYLVSSYSPFVSILLNQIYTNVKTPKRKLALQTPINRWRTYSPELLTRQLRHRHVKSVKKFPGREFNDTLLNFLAQGWAIRESI